MRISFDVPSAAIGALVPVIVTLAVSTSLLSSVRFLDYSGTSPLWALAGLAVLAGCARSIGSRKISCKPGKMSSARLADAFPAAVRGVGTEQSLSPGEWVDLTKAAMPWLQVDDTVYVETCVRIGLENQVRHRVDPDLRRALEICFGAFSMGGGDPWRFVRELAVRMNAVLESGVPFDVDAYVEACAGVGYARTLLPAPFSAFPVVDLVKRYHDCRTKGALPSAEFVWLKRVDRTLWYALNNVGRNTFHVEALGIVAHYERQKASLVVLFEPAVEEAVAGVMAYLADDLHPGTEAA